MFRNKPKPIPQPPLATSNALLGLAQRLSLGHQKQGVRIVAFIAARPGEGTSTLARNYALALAAQSHQKVLLIDAGNVEKPQGIIDAVIVGQPIHENVDVIEQNVSVGHLVGGEVSQVEAGKVIHDPTFWKSLLESYDLLVIDVPSLHSSFDGVTVAAKADATIIVVEAEKTPQPVIENLRNTLTAEGAKVAGIVMNKRRYYIPQPIYRKL